MQLLLPSFMKVIRSRSKVYLRSMCISALMIFSSPIALAGISSTMSVSYTGDTFQNVSGGVRRGNEYLDLLDITLNTDVELSKTWTLTAAVQGLYSNGNSISEELAGDIHILSNLDGGGAFTKLGQATVQLTSTAGSVLVGLYDINAEFDVLESANLFINSAHGIGNDIALTGENGPSIYPFYSFGVRAKFNIHNNQSIKVAILDAAPGSETSLNTPQPEFNSDEGFFTIAEYAYELQRSKLLLGVWQYSKDVETNNRQIKNMGAYARFEHQFNDQRTQAFVRIGYANEKANLHDWFIGTGISYTDPFNINENDIAGFAIAYVQRGERDDAERALTQPHETSFELTYLKNINEHFYLQPNVQYIENAGFENRHALAIGVRLQVTF